jgi:hypothetical protein
MAFPFKAVPEARETKADEKKEPKALQMKEKKMGIEKPFKKFRKM